MPKYTRARPYDFVRTVKNTSNKLSNLATQRLSGTIGTGSNFQITEDGFLLYNGAPGPGTLIMSYAAAANMDQYGNAFPAGLNVTAGVITGVDFSGTESIINPGPILLRTPKGAALQIFTAIGATPWVAPAGVTSVQALCFGPSGKGGNGSTTKGGGGGGGGECAIENVVAVTAGNTYFPTVGAPGNPTFFTGDSLTVQANQGQDGFAGSLLATSGRGGLGGTGSTNSLHYDGGPGGDAANGGGGGGGSAGSGGPGSAGGDDTTGSGGLGGLPQSGFGGEGGGHGGASGGGAGTQGSGSTYSAGGSGGGGKGGGTGAPGNSGGVVLVWQTSTGTVTPFCVTGQNFTDPISGFTFLPGISHVDPVFGDSIRIFGATIQTGGNSGRLNLNGSLNIPTAGNGILVGEGSNAKQGVVTLVAGQAVVANTSITANSRIQLTSQADGGTPGWLRVSTRTAGTSFTIQSSSGTDTSTVAYFITEPGA